MYQVEMVITDSTMDTAELSTWKGVKMTEKLLEALGYVSLKSNGVHGGRDRGIRQLPGYSHYKELGTIQNVVIHFLKRWWRYQTKRSGKVSCLLYVCVCWVEGGSHLFFEVLVVFEINHKR